MDERTTSPADAASAGHITLPPTIRSFRSPEPARARPGRPRVVGGYEVIEEIGRGGTGVVYKARQVQLGRLVALKMIRSADASREELLRFRTEAEAIARLSHPNIVTIYEVGEHDDQPFLSLELCGEGLDRYLAGKPQAPAAVGPLVEAVARAVHFAHQNGIVHRDLKPANVLLQPAETAPAGAGGAAPAARSLTWTTPKVADFGLAKRLDTSAAQTQVGEVMGTPAYMAPEQAEGRNEAVGPAADVWALGAILYECLTGRPPFVAGTLAQLLEQVRHHDLIAPSQLVAGVPRDLEVICLKCLSKSPERRYATAHDLAEDLRRWSAGEPIVARPAGPLERAVRWARRRPVAASLAGLTVVLAVVLALGARWHILCLQAKVEEAREAMLAAHERNRRADLTSECERRLAAGREAMSKGTFADAHKAAVAFATVLELITPADAEGDPSLLRLLRQAESLAQSANDEYKRLTEGETARQQARRFYALRDEAFLQLHLDLLAGPQTASPRACVAAARQALYSFPELATLPRAEREALRLARQEVLCLLAEATARAGDSPARWLEALDVLKEAGDLASVSLRRARYLKAAGDPEGEAAAKLQAASAQPRGELDWLLLGQDRLLTGDPRGALRHLDRAVASGPPLFWAQFLKALAHLQLGELPDGRAALTACAAQRPDFVWVYLLRGCAHGQERRYGEAEADFARASPLAVDRAARYLLHVNRGVVAIKSRQAAVATRELEQAVRLWPDRYHAHANLAQAHRAAGRLDRALAALTRAAGLAPNDPSVLRSRASLHQQCGDLRAALGDIEAALALTAPAQRGALLAERAWLLYQSRRYPEAVTASEQAIRLTRGAALALRVRAESLLELRRHREALAAFDRYLKVAKADVEVYRRRARARAGAGDLAGVVADYTAALAIRRDAGLLAARGWAYLVSGAAQPALRDFEGALALEPAHIEARLGRASARLDQKELQPALGDVEAALRQGPRSSRQLYRAATVLARASEQAPARQALQLRQKAIEQLRAAVVALPADERGEFWRKQVLADPAFRPLAGQAGLGQLDRKYRPADTR